MKNRPHETPVRGVGKVLERKPFTPLESPGIYAGDVINRKHQLLVKVGSKPRLSNGVYSIIPMAPIRLQGLVRLLRFETIKHKRPHSKTLEASLTGEPIAFDFKQLKCYENYITYTKWFQPTKKAR